MKNLVFKGESPDNGEIRVFLEFVQNQKNMNSSLSRHVLNDMNRDQMNIDGLNGGKYEVPF